MLPTEGSMPPSAGRSSYRMDRYCRAAVAVVNQSVVITASVQRLLKRIKHEIGLHRRAHPPANDHARKHIDHEGDEHRTAPGCHIRGSRPGHCSPSA